MRIAVIGCGSIGKRHIANLLALGQRDILIHDTNAEAQGRAGIDPCIRACSSLDVLWDKEPDTVLICTPPKSHTELALAAIDAGCIGLFIEKPLSNSFAELERTLIKRSKDLLTMVACNWRFHEGPIKLKGALNSGIVRQPHNLTAWHYSYLPKWRPGVDWCRHYSASVDQGGVTFEVAWHLVDLALWLFGPAKLVEAETTPATALKLETDGYVGLELRHAHHRKSLIEADFQYRRNSWAFTVQGLMDCISWDSKRSKDYDPNQMYLAELRHFLDCVQAGRQTCNPMSEAVKVLEILLEAKRCQKY